MPQCLYSCFLLHGNENTFPFVQFQMELCHSMLFSWNNNNNRNNSINIDADDRVADYSLPKHLTNSLI